MNAQNTSGESNVVPKQEKILPGESKCALEESKRVPDVLKHNWFWILAYVSVFGYFVVRFFDRKKHIVTLDVSTLDILRDTLTFPLVLLMAIVFVHIYTEPIPLSPAEGMEQNEKAKKDEEKRQKEMWQRRNWSIFAYVFMLFSLALAIYPFIQSWAPETKPEQHEIKADQQMNIIPEEYRERPIWVFVGCSLTEKTDLSCRSEQPGQNQQGALNTQSDKNQQQAQDKDNGAWIINVGGYVKRCSSEPNSKIPVCQVSGGLLVPLYVIILALMGGSISLTRRLPEHQKCASPEYVTTEKEPKLSQHEFREYLIFQIVQFISAPLIAVLAYYLVRPSDLKISVALAFAAGFASESILLMIRSVADKITPTTAASALKFGTITGVVMLGDSAVGDKKGKAANKAEVSLTAMPQIHTLTDESGHYVLANVPVGEHGIKGVCKSDGATFEKAGPVKIERVQEIVSMNLTLERKPDQEKR